MILMLQFKEGPSPLTRALSVITLTAAAIGAGATGVSIKEAEEYHNPAVGTRASNLEFASWQLDPISKHPNSAKQSLDYVEEIIGDEGNIDDRLRETSQDLSGRGPDHPVTQAELDKIQKIRADIKAISKEYRVQSHNHAEKYVAIFGLGTVGALAAWFAVQIAEQSRQERKYN